MCVQHGPNCVMGRTPELSAYSDGFEKEKVQTQKDLFFLFLYSPRNNISKQIIFNQLEERQINSTCSQSIALHHPSFRIMIGFQFIIQSVSVDDSL